MGLAYLADAWPEDGFAEAAESLLENAIGQVARRNMRVGLMQGFTGVAWALAHLFPDDDATSEIDDALIEVLSHPRWMGEYDLVSGLTGIGVYGLERFPRGRAEELLGHVVARLAEKAEPAPGGLRWFTPPELILASRLGRAPYGFYNLGMAHGLPAVVALLVGIYGTGIDAKEVARLLDGAIGYLLQTRLPEGSPATWPYFLGREIETMPSRLAWCYGDPGIVCALTQAGVAFGRDQWLEAAWAAGERIFARPEGSEGVQSAGLCHGTAGLALIFDRLFHLTGDDRYAQQARRWAAQTVALKKDDAELLFSIWDPDSEKGGDVQGPGLLAGTAGIAGALLACAGEMPPTWDRMLLLSTPVFR